MVWPGTLGIQSIALLIRPHDVLGEKPVCETSETHYAALASTEQLSRKHKSKYNITIWSEHIRIVPSQISLVWFLVSITERGQTCGYTEKSYPWSQVIEMLKEYR